MKTIIRSLITILAFAVTSAFAAEPVAVWNGEDLNGTTQGGVTLNLNGNAYADGAITISGSNGVLLNNANANVCSVIIEYENFNTAANAAQTLFTLQKSGGEDNNIGVYWNTNAKVHGIYKNSSWDNDYTANPIPASGRLCFGYNKGGNGVTVYAGNVTVYDASGLKEGGSTYTGVAIGGYRGTTAIGVASNMKITAIAFFTSKLSASDAAAYEFPSNSTGPQLVWEGNSATANKTLSQAVEKGKPFTLIVNMTNTDSSTPAGSYIINKINPGQIITPFCIATESFTGFNTSGNVPNSCVSYYEKKSGGFWVGVGSRSNSGNATWNEEKKGDDVSAYDSIYVAYSGTVGSNGQVASYVRMIYAHNKNTDQYYTLSSTSASLTISDSLDTMNVNSSADALSFKVYLDNIQRNADGIKQAIEDIINPPASVVSATISGDTTWGNLGWSPSAPTASDKAELMVSANAKLTIDDDTAFKSLKLIGARNLTIAGITSSNVALLSKISIGSFTGKLTFEIDASAGFTADDTLKNLIKSANTQYTFVFKSTVANKGAAINYGDTDIKDGQSFKTHIVFEGGAHTFQYRAEYASLKFGANATSDNPTIRITNNATLTFAARNLCGWTSGNSNADGIIRVDNGSKLYLNPTGGTLYWAQQFYLEPGAQLTYSDGASFRINGGTNYAPQIFVPSSNTDMTATPARIIRSGNNDFCVNGQGTKGMAISVGANSKLTIESGIALNDANCDIIKLGDGILEVAGNIVNQNFIVDDGSVSLRGSITKLTFNQNGALDLNNGAPTITGSLVTAVEKQLKLVIDNPTHMMEVITLPAAADKTGWTAIVNGREAENELIVDGNTLKLKWRIPPTIKVDIDDITIESTSDWNGGTVKIDVSKRDEHDYKGAITYWLKFGDKTVEGSVENNVATFTLDTDFTAGNIYRGIFELGYGDAGDTIEAAEVIVYEGKLAYKNKDDLWVNETPTTLKSTGSYDPDNVTVVDDIIEINTQDKVTFSPTLDPDYVDKCDSELTMTIFASEAVDDDMSVEEGAQAGVMIISDGSDGVEFRFIGCDENGEWQWMQGPAAELNTDYEVTISFHYAKDADDSDSVTYTIKGFTGGSYTYAHRPNTADKVTEIVFADGTRFKSLTGTCQIEVADPVAQGIKPGEKQEITADNDDEAQEKAAKIPVMIPEDEAVIDVLNTDEAKDTYKRLFRVVAVKKDSSYMAEVVFAEEAKKDIKDDEEKILTEVVSALSSLLGEEGELENITGQPGLYYGIASDGELVKMGNAQPDDWKIAGADGNIVGLKVKKTASAKQGFYKVICTPTKPAK